MQIAMSCLIYIVCDSDYARGYSIANYDIAGSSTLMVPSTPYHEHYALIHSLTDSSWDGKQYVGILSWRANRRMIITSLVNSATSNNADVIARTTTMHPHPHPHFQTMWELLCKELGYTALQWANPQTPIFADWVASPTWMTKYIAHIQKAYAIMEKPAFKAKLRERPSIIHKKLVYLEPADLLQRLPGLFFSTQGSKVVPANPI